MKIRIPYQISRDQSGTTSWSVLIQVRLSTSDSSASVVSLVDSGASICLFDATVAAKLGIALEAGVPSETTGIGGTEAIWLHPVTLHLPGGPVSIHAAFQRSLPVSGILGMAGFFEHFRITFNASTLNCEFERLFHSAQ